METSKSIRNVEPAADIPQADRFEIIVELPFLIKEGINSKQKIAEHYRFDPRQGDYYAQAADMLGLCFRQKGSWLLTGLGEEYVKEKSDKRRLFLAQLLYKMRIIQIIISTLIGKPTKEISNNELIDIIEQNSICNHTTATRRAQTIRSWLRWLELNLGLISVKAKGINLIT